ncbi:C6 zinc finger domain-containing protein [Lophiostoma macrostomum CBS 122681]|uniref:C6 zinc finger domain-containing protein n=1 Tax=Lophiostoma macrostomum CBS 122681 TaxID=1314788 RepID=A0A6A6SMQ1_9PLEO|nr:C6 zinc finger domain-containing protein [Lophiostoma macrostomum CBS 122681]
MAQDTEPQQKRQCWECFRRRLVCDFTRPCCKKCIKTGKDCPGYDEKKPLKWVEPGKVASKRRQRQNICKGDGGVCQEAASTASSEVSRADHTRLPVIVKDGNVEDFEVIFNPCFEMIDRTTDIVRAINYYNTHVYPELLVITEFVPNPYIIHFPLEVLPYLPPSIHHTMACFAISHRMNQLRLVEDSNRITTASNRILHHRGEAIRDLGEAIATPENQTSDFTLTSVLLLLTTEPQHGFKSPWRAHAHGLNRLIKLRGGFGSVFQSSIHLQPVLVLYMLFTVYSNSTSHSADQLDIMSPLLLVPQVADMYKLVFPHVLCPQSLFLDLITINNLRAQTMDPRFTSETSQSTAEHLLAHLETFFPAKWVEENTDNLQEVWKLIASIHQSSIIIYCIMSLQSLSLLPINAQLEATRSFHGFRLFECLQKARVSRFINKFIMWPVVVSGVEAVYRSPHVRHIVAKQLAALSQDLGTATPLQANVKLEAFWASGKFGWDDCFDGPYSFFI